MRLKKIQVWRSLSCGQEDLAQSLFSASMVVFVCKTFWYRFRPGQSYSSATTKEGRSFLLFVSFSPKLLGLASGLLPSVTRILISAIDPYVHASLSFTANVSHEQLKKMV
jgi:hypothetical protein